MPVEVILPQEGMAMESATVVAWLREVGDPVEKDDVIVEVESEKSAIEITAPESGTLAEIRVPEGDEVPVRSVLAVIALPGERLAADPERRPTGDQASAISPTAAASGAGPDRPRQPTVSGQVAPIARRLAKDAGLDLGTVEGTGFNGRITADDVRRVLENTAPPTQRQPPAVTRRIPLRGMRGTIADRMVASLQTAAQLTLHTEVDVTEMVRWRATRTSEVAIGYNHVLIRACALALKAHPRLNAVIEDAEIRLLEQINIGLAVAIEEGLVVATLRDADEKTLEVIATECDALISDIRAGHATPDATSGSTFTISNLGAYGIDAFTPIINPPEVAILGVGRIRESPVRRGDTFDWRHALALSLTFDHRATDGVPAAEFLRTLAEILADPRLIVSRTS